MKVLLITWHFPPHNNIAAIRAGKLARFLVRRGHEVRVLTTRKSNPDRSLPVEIPEEHVIAGDWYDVDKLAHPVAAWRRRKAKQKAQHKSSSRSADKGRQSRFERGFRQRFSAFYNSLFFFPDRYVGWYPHQVKDGDALVRHWRPDVIYASGPPFSTFMGASRLARKHRIPWIAEFRDRWTDDPYFPPPKWRAQLDVGLENWLIHSASGLVTVSPPWVDFYQRKHARTTVLAYNGFSSEDFPNEALDSDPGPVRIVHMGTVYAGRRDPKPLLLALAGAGFDSKDVRVYFYGYGRGLDIIRHEAKRLGVEAFVEIHPPVPYKESLEIQRRADLLLLLQWNDPREQGNLPAKLFEYLAVRRPILGIGLQDGVPAGIIRKKQAGQFINDPGEIAQHLRELIAEKQAHGTIKPLPESVSQGLSRDEQYDAVERLLEKTHYNNRTPSVTAIRTMPRFELADTSKLGQRPVLCVAVDAEEDFDWRAPLSRDSTSVDSISHQYLAQEIFARYGVTPTYLVDYPVATDPTSIRVLRKMLDAGQCEIGAQLHPWVNPPHEEEVSVRNSFSANLPQDLQKRKLAALTSVISRNFGLRPRVFKAGRYGFDVVSAELLEEFGYEVDTSVMPFSSYASEEGPNFFSIPDRPFWFGKNRSILELPLTRGFTGLIGHSFSGRLATIWDTRLLGRLHISGILSRLRLAERITLTPEGIDHHAHRRLTQRLLASGHQVFQLIYHSSSLVPGNTPYVRNEDDLKGFLDRIIKYLDFFFTDVGGIPLTHQQLYRTLSLDARVETEPSGQLVRPRKHDGEEQRRHPLADVANSVSSRSSS